MNSLEAEYSFLAPTWKLPTVATSSIYSRNYGSSYTPASTVLGPDWPSLNNTSYNSRYIPPYVPTSTVRRGYPASYNTFQASISRPYPSNYSSQPSGPYSGPNDTFDQYNQPTTDSYRLNHGGEDGLNLTISVHPTNDYPRNLQQPDRNDNSYRGNGTMNRPANYGTNDQNNSYNSQPNQRRRVQIVDHSRQTPSTGINEYSYGKNSRNSIPTPTHSYVNRTPDPTLSQGKQKPYSVAPANGGSTVPPRSSYSHPRAEYTEESRNENKSSIHEYLYGLANPDPGSYVNAYKNHQRRLQDERLGRKSVMSDYKTFAQNGGFGPTFNSGDHYANIDRSDIEKKRRSYAKVVKETNQQKLEEQRRGRTVSRQKRNRVPQIPKTQRAREYAETIERPHHLRPVLSSDSNHSVSLVWSTSDFHRISSADRTSSLLIHRFRSRIVPKRTRSLKSSLDLPICLKGIRLDLPIDHRPIVNRRCTKSAATNEIQIKSITKHSLTKSDSIVLPTATVLIDEKNELRLRLKSASMSTAKFDNHNVQHRSRAQTAIQSIPGRIRLVRHHQLDLESDIKIQSFAHQTTIDDPFDDKKSSNQ